MCRRLITPLLLTSLVLLPTVAVAQTGASGRGTPGRGQNPRVIQIEPPADEVRDELRGLLERYPPALGRVLKLDPSLMSNEAYLTPYPALAEFLSRNPQVPHNASYYLNFVSVDSSSPFSRPDTPELAMRREAISM